MEKDAQTVTELLQELEELRVRLKEAEDTLQAICNGEVDALVVNTPEGDQIFTLSGADRPYRLVLEMMQEGTAILTANGTIFYCNACFANMVKRPLEKVIGRTIDKFLPTWSKETLKPFMKTGCNGLTNESALLDGDGTAIPVLLALSSLEGINADGAFCLVATDISERIAAEESLRKSEQELRIKTESLQEVNAALKVLLKRVEEGQIDLEEKILSNIRELVLPYLDKLRKKAPLSGSQLSYLDIAETNLDHIASSFLYHLKVKYLNLTNREMQIASLVKDGKSVKDIASLLNVSKKTVDFHRNSLRRKLGLTNKKANLRSYLLTFLQNPYRR